MTDDLTVEALIIYNSFLDEVRLAADLPENELRQLYDKLCRRLDELPNELAAKLLDLVDDVPWDEPDV